MAKQSAPALAGMPRANLMPRSELAKRERERLTRRWMWGVLGAVAVSLAIIAGAFWLNVFAMQRLSAEQARTTDLLLELSTYSDVSGALAAEAELTDFRGVAMATDLRWSPAAATVSSVLPGDALMTGFELVVGGVPQGDDATLEAGLLGTVSVESPRPLDIVDISRAVRGAEGVLYADGQSVLSSASTGGQFAYILNVTFDQTIYTGEYTTAEEGTE